MPADCDGAAKESSLVAALASSAFKEEMKECCHMPVYARRSHLVLFVGLAAILAGVMPARPHIHVDRDGQQVSWYPPECCHGRDCRPVATIKSAPLGLWMTTVDGFTVLVGPRDQRRPSLDQRWHICMGPGEMDDAGPQIYCIFEPPNS